MPQGGMEDVCRVVVTMGGPMSHEFSLQMPHFLRSYTGWGGVIFTLMVQVMMTSMSGQSL